MSSNGTTTKVFLAEVLERGAGAYAAYAAQLLLERHPESRSRFEPDAFTGWREHIQGRIYELAAALAVGEPQVFAKRISWAKAAFEAREVPVKDLRESLRCLQEVLESELPSRNGESLDPWFTRAIETLDAPAPSQGEALPQEGEARRVVASYLNAVLEGDRAGASAHVLNAVREQRLSVKQAYMDVLVPAEVELGRLWHLNEIGVGEEHFATSVTQMVLGQLYAMIERQPPVGRTVLTAPAERNRHSIGSRVIADFFEMAGWRAIALEEALPIHEMLETISIFKVDLVAISASMSVQLRGVTELVTEIRRTPETSRAKVMVGGLAFGDSSELWQRVGADGYAADPEAAVKEGTRLLGLQTA